MVESILFCDLWSCLCVDCRLVLAYALSNITSCDWPRACCLFYTQPTRRVSLYVPFSSWWPSTVLTYPVPLEAFLATEVGFLAQLLAGWALQGTGIVAAVIAFTFAFLLDRHLFCWSLIHDCYLDRKISCAVV